MDERYLFSYQVQVGSPAPGFPTSSCLFRGDRLRSFCLQQTIYKIPQYFSNHPMVRRDPWRKDIAFPLRPLLLSPTNVRMQPITHVIAPPEREKQFPSFPDCLEPLPSGRNQHSPQPNISSLSHAIPDNLFARLERAMLFSSQRCTCLSIWTGRGRRKEQKATKSPMKHSGSTAR